MKTPIIGVGVSIEDHMATLDRLPETLGQMERCVGETRYPAF